MFNLTRVGFLRTFLLPTLRCTSVRTDSKLLSVHNNRIVKVFSLLYIAAVPFRTDELLPRTVADQAVLIRTGHIESSRSSLKHKLVGWSQLAQNMAGTH